jgi:hypothetical protein
MRDEVARALATRALEIAQKAKAQRGEKGEKGDAGEIIVQPNKGDQGERGPIGPQGIPGKSITGAKGDKGDKGDIGQQGNKGDQGNPGKDGAKGDRGERGFTGVKGIDGVQGPIGPMPKHEKKGLMLRFEKEPGIWGEWIVMPTGGGGGGGRDDKLTDRQKELIALVDAYNLQSANPGKYLKTNGTTLSWDTLDTNDITGLGTMSAQNANAVAITGGTATLTSVTTPTVQATNSAGLSLKNSGGTTQISMGAGGGDNISFNSSTNINGTNAQVDISPTGTGHVHIKPTGVNSVEIAPTYVGEMDNITIGAITPAAGTFTLISNTRINPRVLASTANSATPTLNTDSYDMMVITGQSVAITNFSTNLTGTPVNGQKLIISITGTGAIAITWGTSFESSTVTLPSTTVTTNRLDIGFIWNVATSKWRCVASA